MLQQFFYFQQQIHDSLLLNIRNSLFYFSIKNLLTALMYITKYDIDIKNPPSTSLV